MEALVRMVVVVKPLTSIKAYGLIMSNEFLMLNLSLVYFTMNRITWLGLMVWFLHNRLFFKEQGVLSKFVTNFYLWRHEYDPQIFTQSLSHGLINYG